MAKPEPAAPPPPSPIGSTDRAFRWVTLVAGFVFLATMSYGGYKLLTVTKGAFLPPHWAAFYILVSLVTGLGFWLFSGSAGNFTWKQFGLRLSGGAAIGAGFMLLAHKLTPESPPNLNIIEVLLPGDAVPGIVRYDGGVSRVTPIPGEQRYIVEFRENAMSGNVHVRYLGPGGARLTRTYVVPRIGHPPPPVDRQEN